MGTITGAAPESSANPCDRYRDVLKRRSPPTVSPRSKKPNGAWTEPDGQYNRPDGQNIRSLQLLLPLCTDPLPQIY
jgi:hypothetical protein